MMLSALFGMAIRRSRSYVVNQTKNEMFPLCRQAILSIKKSTLKEEDRETGTLTAKVGLSWKSFGELVKVSVKPLKEGGTLIEMVSVPWWPMTKVDYGKNTENIEAISSYLKRKLGDQLTDLA